MFPKKIWFPFFLFHGLRFLLTYGIMIASGLWFALEPNGLSGMVLFGTALFVFTVGQKLKSLLYQKSLDLQNAFLVECVKTGDPVMIRQVIRMLKVLAVLSLPGFPYACNPRIKIYVMETLLHPGYDKHRNRLIRSGFTYFLSGNSMNYSDLFASVIYQYAIKKDCLSGARLLETILPWFVPLDEQRFVGTESFQSVTSYPGFTVHRTGSMNIAFQSTGWHERVIRRYKPRFDSLYRYLVDPTDEAFNSLLSLLDRLYEARKALAFCAMIEFAAWRGRDDHAEIFRQRLLSTDTGLPWVEDFRSG
jgi:hypothetical protein